MKRIIIIIVVLSIGLAVALYFQLGRLEARKFAAAGGTGVIEGVEVDISARIPARINRVLVREGDTVRADQLVVELDCTEPRAVLAQAEAGESSARATVQAAQAAVEAARLNSKAARTAIEAVESQVQSIEVGKDIAARDADRVQSMSQAGAISEARLDQAQTRVSNLNHQISAMKANQAVARERAMAAKGGVKVAEAQALAAEGQLEVARAGIIRAQAAVDECKLVAPRAGLVLSRNYEPGESVLPGAKLITLVDLTEARATFYLPNAELAAAATGKPVTVRADAYPNDTFQGTIHHVSAQAEFTPRNVQTREDRDRLVFGVEIVIPNQDGRLRPGMPVEVAIDGTERKE